MGAILEAPVPNEGIRCAGSSERFPRHSGDDGQGDVYRTFHDTTVVVPQNEPSDQVTSISLKRCGLPYVSIDAIVPLGQLDPRLKPSPDPRIVRRPGKA